MTRKETISTLITIKMLFDNIYAREAIDIAIEELKNRSQGKWVESDIGWKCSECNYGVKPWNNTNFCPNCGSDMGGEE